MIRINLLPVRQIRQRLRTRNEAIGFLAGFLLLLLLLGFVGLAQARKITGLKTEVGGLQTEKAKYEKVIQQIERIKAEQQTLETKLGVIQELKVYSQLPVRLLDEIANLTPSSRMWLETLSLSNHQIALGGVALDNATIASFMEQVKASQLFTGAELRNSSQVDKAGQKLKSFAMTLDARAPAKKPAPAPAPAAAPAPKGGGGKKGGGAKKH